MSKQPIYVLDTRNLSENMKITCVTLQGLVNRKEPKLYLLWYGQSRESFGVERVVVSPAPDCDTQWLQYYKEEHGLEHEPINSPIDAISKFASEVDGYIVYDPNFRDTINVATTMAGVKNAIVASPEHVEVLTSLGLRPMEDLRGRWQNKLDAYRWAFKEFWPECSHKLLGSVEIDPRGFNRHHIRDYLVAHKVFTYDLSNNPRDKEEIALIDEIQSAAEPLSMVLGWRTSRDGPTYYVARNAIHGNTAICCLASPNLSFHFHIKAKTKVFKQKHKHIDPNQVRVEPKVYVTFMLTDGDSMHMMLSFQGDRWNDPNRGKVPFAWGILPLLLDFAPAVLEYYYKTLTENDYLVTALGLGYTYLGLMPKEATINYYELLRKYVDKLDLKVLWAIDRDPFHKPFLDDPGHLQEVMKEHRSRLPNLIGVIEGFLQPPKIPILWAEDIPIVVCKVASHDVYQTYRDIRKMAEAFKERPLFLFVAVGNYISGVSEVKAVAELLDPAEYKVVLPDEFLIAVRKAKEANLPYR